MIKKKWIVSAAVSVILGAALLSGCGAKDDNSGTGTKVESSRKAASVQEEEKAAGEAAKKTDGEAPENDADMAESSTDGAADSTKDSADGADSSAGSTDAAADGAAAKTEDKNDVFGEFKTFTLYGDEADQEIFADKELTMVNIWGTFCGPCVREMPELGELNREYADKGFQIVGIITDVSQVNDEVALEVVEKTKADYTHLIISEDLYYSVLSQAQVVPTTIFIDKNGNQVGKTYTGAKNKKQWTAVIDEMLEKVES